MAKHQLEIGNKILFNSTSVLTHFRYYLERNKRGN